MKIRLFDGLFRSSDNILRNILVDKDGVLLSIDEGDLYGKRDKIFNHNEWCQKKNVSDEILQEVVMDILSDREKKIKLIEEKMIKYEFNHFVNEFKTRFKDYRQIIQSEWK